MEENWRSERWLVFRFFGDVSYEKLGVSGVIWAAWETSLGRGALDTLI